MTPVKQNVLYSDDAIGNGNCLAACLATLLDLPLWMVPPFEQMFGRDAWRMRTHEWTKRFFNLDLVRTGGHEIAAMPKFYIANGPSPRGVYHSVVYSAGQLVHDPHFSDAGIADVEWTYHLAPLAE